MLEHQCRHVRAQAEEQGLSQREQSDATQQQVHRQRQTTEDQGLRGQAQVEHVAQGERGGAEDQGPGKEQDGQP